MMRTILLAVFSLCCTTLYAQWTPLPSLAIGTDTASQVTVIKSFKNNLYFCTNRGLFMSADNGNSWSNLTYTNAATLNRAIRAVHMDTTSGAMYVSSDSAVFISTDNGATWTAGSVVSGGVVNDISQSGNVLLVSYGTFPNGGVYYSTDGMVTINAATIANKAYFYFWPEGATVYLAGNEGVYKSTDNGMTWAISGTGFPAGVSNQRSLVKAGATFFSGNIGGNGLFISSDNGATWTEADTAVFTGFCQVFDVTAANGTILATMDGACNAGNPIKASTDGGVTWTPYMTGLVSGFYPVLGRNTSGSCFFTFKNNEKVPYRICDPTGVTDQRLQGRASVYPNPAQSSVTIALTDRSSFRVKIVDITGQVKYASTATKKDKVIVDVAHLSPGVYFVQISTATGLQAMKFVKQ